MADNAVDEAPRGASARGTRPRNPFAAIAQFFREVIAELSKVVTPTRRELVRYTLVVLAFVVIMMLIVAGLDLVFGSLVRGVFADVWPWTEAE